MLNDELNKNIQTYSLTPIMPVEFIIPIIIFCGALIYATFGFGDALFAMPFLSVLLGIKTATPLMTLNGCTLATILLSDITKK